MLECKSGLAGSGTTSDHNRVSFQKASVQHRVEFDNTSFLSSHCDLPCLSFEILQILHDSLLSGLVSGTVKENYLPTSDLFRAQDTNVHHVLNIGLNCCPESANSFCDAVEAAD